jgi:putative flippase GtrA
MKIFRYFMVGGVAAIVDISVFMLLAKLLKWPWFPAALMSFILATLVNYFLSVRHVFSSGVRFRRHQELALVFIVSAVGLVINQMMLWLLIEQFKYYLLTSKISATAVVFFWNYSSRKYFVFKEAKDMNT